MRFRIESTWYHSLHQTRKKILLLCCQHRFRSDQSSQWRPWNEWRPTGSRRFRLLWRHPCPQQPNQRQHAYHRAKQYQKCTGRTDCHWFPGQRLPVCREEIHIITLQWDRLKRKTKSAFSACIPYARILPCSGFRGQCASAWSFHLQNESHRWTFHQSRCGWWNPPPGTYYRIIERETERRVFK